jgi:hypothetical protein
MTSDVMAGAPSGGQSRAMSIRIPVLAVLVPFLAFSVWVAATAGPLGFLTLAGREPWGLQMLLDLAIALFFVTGWMIADARRRGRNAWPFVAMTVALGSIGPLTYLLLRGSSRPAA